MTGTPKSGRILRVSGLTLFITAILTGTVFRFVPQSEMDAPLVIISWVPLPMILIGVFLYWRGRQYAAREVAEDVLTESRPHVLYLRPFKSDISTIRYVFSALLTPQIFSGLATEEEQLRDVLQPFGDLVAIGRPGESLPKPGAARLYASNEEWKDVVKAQMLSARLIVIRAGIGEGLLWELKEAFEIVNPQKLLILVLNMKGKHYASLCERANPVLGVSLPPSETLPRSWGRISGFVRFSADWKPSFLPCRVPFFRRSAYKPFLRLFKFALRPVFESFGLEWQAPKVSTLTVSGIAFLSLIGLLVLLAVSVSLWEWWSSRGNIASAPTAVQESAPSSQEQPYRSAVAEAEARFQDRLTATPSVRTQLESLVNSAEVSALPPEEAVRRAQELGQEFGRVHSRAGLRRLDDSALLTKLELDRKILAVADPVSCAAFAHGNISHEQLSDLLERLEVSDMELWFDLIFQAVKADVEGAPARTVDRDRFSRALASVMKAPPEQDSQELRRIMADYSHASNEQVCWSERTIRERIAQLDTNDRIAWALAMAR